MKLIFQQMPSAFVLLAICIYGCECETHKVLNGLATDLSKTTAPKPTVRVGIGERAESEGAALTVNGAEGLTQN